MESLNRIRAAANAGATDDENCHAECRRLSDHLEETLDVTARVQTGLFLVDPTDDDSMDYQHSWIQIPARDVESYPADIFIDPTVQQFANPDQQPEGVAPLDCSDDVLVVSMLDDITAHYQIV